MATIVEMINPLTGLPEQVDKLDHTAQEIDDAVGRSLPGAAIDASIQAKPNPNLLDNWYFGNPVNQRGQTSYSGIGYCIDRWKMVSSGMSVTLTDEGLTIEDTAGAVPSLIFDQIWDDDTKAQYLGKTITCSVLVKSISGSIVVQAGERSMVMTAPGLHSFLIKSYGNSSYAIRFYNTTVNAKCTILAAKLELGDTQTLAHQDANGNWVLNEIPDYGEQLRRCQYYSRFFGEDIEVACSNNAAGSYIEGTLPLTMRSGSGAISFANSYLFTGNGTYYQVTSATVTSNGGRVKIGVNVNGQLDANLQATLHLKDCSILFNL